MLESPTGGATLGAVNSASVAIIDAATEFVNSGPLDAAAGQTVSSDVTVSGYHGNISGMRVTLFGVSATTADDLDVLLVDPAGHKYALVGDVGGATNLNNVSLTLEDNGSAGSIPDSAAFTEGRNYQPTNCVSPVTDFTGSPEGTIVEPGCGPVSVNTMGGTFGGQNPNGAWTLYVRNDGGGAFGASSVSAAGWGIQFIAPTAAPVSISGRVMTANGQGISGAVVTVTGGGLAEPMTARTGTFGYYTFDGIVPARVYIVSAESRRFTIANAVRSVSLTDTVAGLDFVAEPR
jgi:hypothetical protein